jgi:hypothetical protein
MKKIILLVVISFIAVVTQAQITITTSDLPVNGTIAVRSTGAAFAGMDVTLTGANYTWDYTQLTPTGQQIDTFFSETAGNPLLSLYFSNTSFNPNRSNHSSPGPDFSVGATLTLSNVFNYYYNSTSAYSQTGLGAEVNGVPLPVTFNPHDRIYQLPMNFNQQDSVTFQYGIDLTTTVGLFYSVRKTRTNFVDGWGTVQTPFQNYSALRVRTRIVEVDSIYIDSLGFGFATPPITTYEYKWLANGQRVPVLQINTAANGTTPTSIVYKDSPVSVPVTSVASASWAVYPVPVSEKLNVRFSGYKTGMIHYQLISLTGAIVLENDYSVSSADEVLALDASSLATGTYLLKISDGSGSINIKPVVKR